MLTKILLTIAIIIGSIMILRHRRLTRQPVIKQIVIEEENEFHWLMKWFAYGLVSLVLLTGAIMYYLEWREDHRLYDIKIINPQTGKVDQYQAYKKDMFGRTFISITGERIAASELERLEFVETSD